MITFEDLEALATLKGWRIYKRAHPKDPTNHDPWYALYPPINSSPNRNPLIQRESWGTQDLEKAHRILINEHFRAWR